MLIHFPTPEACTERSLTWETNGTGLPLSMKANYLQARAMSLMYPSGGIIGR